MRARKGVHIFMHDAGLFANYQKMEKGYRVLLEMSFYFFSQKNMDGDGICGTLGDALSQSQWGFMGFFHAH
jgi:hypothetical protein